MLKTVAIREETWKVLKRRAGEAGVSLTEMLERVVGGGASGVEEGSSEGVVGRKVGPREVVSSRKASGAVREAVEEAIGPEERHVRGIVMAAGGNLCRRCGHARVRHAMGEKGTRCDCVTCPAFVD